MNELLTFSLVVFLLVISPGPNAVLIVKTYTIHGRSGALLNIFGLFSATFAHGAFSILGLSALVLQSAELFTLIKWLGAAYLFYIGVKALYQSFQFNMDARVSPTVGDHSPSSVKPNKKLPVLSLYFEGVMTQILNPKVSMFYLAAFPQFLAFDAFSYSAAFSMVTIHAVIIFFWFLALTATLHWMRSVKSNAFMRLDLKRWLQRLTGSAMVYFSALVVTQER